MLTDLKVRQAKAAAADYKLGDVGGLYLLVTKGGTRSWRFKYRFAGKEKRLTFGRYPEVSLAQARERRDEAKRILREHRDPAVEAQKRRLVAAAAAEATFECVAHRTHCGGEGGAGTARADFGLVAGGDELWKSLAWATSS